MHSFFQHRGGHYLLLALIALPMFFWNLGAATLWDLDEGRNLVCSYEMMLADNWIVPTFNGELRDHKPVLLYWLQILCFQMGGVNEAMGRLPSALAGLLTLFVAYELGRRMFSKSTGLLAGLAAATSPMLIGAARFANPDALLNLFTTLTMLLTWIIFTRPSAWTYLLLGASTGMAVLAKGPVGLILPGTVTFAYLLCEGGWARCFDRRAVWSVLAFILVAAPWYILVAVITHAHFIKGFFMTHNVDRFLSTMENHRGSVLYYPIVILAGSIPWSLFATGTIWTAFWSCRRSDSVSWREPWERFVEDNKSSRRSRFSFPLVLVRGAGPAILLLLDAVWTALWRCVPGGEPDWRPIRQRAADPTGRGGAAAYRFLAAWTLVYLAFFSISATKLPNYVLPAIVPWTLLSARFLDRWRKETVALPRWYLASVAAGVAVLGVGVGAGLTIAAGVGELSVMRNCFLPGLLPFAGLAIVPLIAAVLLWRAAANDRRAQFVNILVLAATAFLAPLAAHATAALNNAKASEAVARTPAGRTDVDQRVIGMQAAHLPSLNFYLKRDVTHVESFTGLANHLRTPVPTYAVLPEPLADSFAREHPGLGVEIARHHDMYRGKSLVVLANRHARPQ